MMLIIVTVGLKGFKGNVKQFLVQGVSTKSD